MAHPYHHSLSSARRFGGVPQDYQHIHDWFDQSKEYLCDFRHRALRHHAQGIFECERVFGTTLTTSDGRLVPVRLVGEQHVREDCGRIPTLADWLSRIRPEDWMRKHVAQIQTNDPTCCVYHASGGELNQSCGGDKLELTL